MSAHSKWGERDTVNKGWQNKQLKHACAVNRDTLGEETPSDWEMQYLDIGAVDPDGNVGALEAHTFASAPSRARRRVRAGDTVISTVRTYLKAIAHFDQPPENLIASTGFAVLSPTEELDSRFLWRAVQDHEFVEQVVANSEGVGYPAIAPMRLANLPILFPSPAAQRRIAAYLDAATGKIDRLVALRRRQMELLREQRAALIQQAVTRGLDPNAPRKKSIIPWVNQIPKHWKELRIAVAVTKNTNGFVGPTRDILVQDGVRYLQSLHLKSGEIRFDKPYYVTEEWSRAHSKSILQEGDVLVVQTGDIGQVAAVPEEFEGCNCHALIILRMRRAYGCGQYLALLFNAHLGKSALIRETTGALLPHLECGKIRDIRLPFPPPEEQESILEFVQKENHRYNRLLSAYARQIELLGEYRAALIHEAVTGQKAV